MEVAESVEVEMLEEIEELVDTSFVGVMYEDVDVVVIEPAGVDEVINEGD